jgi:predicted small lipoprotein YifL
MAFFARGNIAILPPKHLLMRALLACLALVSLAACGFKGPLYLPKKPQSTPRPAATSASKPANASATASAPKADDASDPVTLDNLIDE